jgi:thiamine-phosphate diphosphorylase/hydroxyethylthiazole kinase
MTVEQARKLLPPGAVIGVSCNTVDHVKEAVRNGVDYIGIGAVWGTQTKKLTSPIIGVRGVGRMLEELDGTSIKAVAIGASPQINETHFSMIIRWYQVDQSSQDFTWNRVLYKPRS